MAIRFALLLAVVAATLVACAKPLPADKSHYVGEWKHRLMVLSISQDGKVRYRRLVEGGSKSVEGPLQGFDGDDFRVGVGPMTTTFDVTVPPHRTADHSWRMTVDGLELIRTP